MGEANPVYLRVLHSDIFSRVELSVYRVSIVAEDTDK